MRYLKLVILLMALGLCGLVVNGLLMGRHTEYCPWSHVLRDTEDCAIRDCRDGMVLIEHHDADNMYNQNNYLEIRDGFQSFKFRLPGGVLKLEGSVALIPNDRGAVLLNGQKTELNPFGNLAAHNKSLDASRASGLLIESLRVT